MAGTKVEVKMKKAEQGSWSKLFSPREVKEVVEEDPKTAPVTEKIDALDLANLIPQRSRLSNEASGGRSGDTIL